MTEYYLVFVVILFALAIVDLKVGVSNDAVNFLNSAVGSRTASFKVILIVTSIGIFIGATFSSGMMEIARKGIFNPQFFQFADVMVIFIAVMIADIMLLDAFTTLGFPTSTTVSIVFELLGAAVVVALLKIVDNGDNLSTLSSYINTASALGIITGILASIVIAFLAGAVIQYLSRLIFTFNYESKLKWVGGVWSGAALSLLTYFLFFKGIKGASFVSEGFINWVSTHILLLLAGSFVFWSLLMQLLYVLFKVNMLRIVVLAGTFSLAMAFAGNDLVNFIGVPIAGFESYKAWVASGLAPGELTMNSLAQPVRTETFLLAIAGLIMVLTLWLSKKSRSVIETELSLARQGEGQETFAPNMLARRIVRMMRNTGNAALAVIPRSVLDKMGARFTPLEGQNEANQPAFDIVRAAVNLSVASTLIAFATSLKLPLSTTYVTFMVAMGASLADRAWGLDSAVYRVAGVLNVIAGWFITALIAFVASGIMAWLIYAFGMWAVVVLLGLLIFFMYRSSALYDRRAKSKEELDAFDLETGSIAAAHIVKDTSHKVAELLHDVINTYNTAIAGLLQEDRSKIQESVQNCNALNSRVGTLRKKMFKAIKRVENEEIEVGRLFLLVYDFEEDIARATTNVVDVCRNHVENSHKSLKKKQAEGIRSLVAAVSFYLEHVARRMEAANFESIATLRAEKEAIYDMMEKLLATQIEGIRNESFGRRNSMLVFSIELETKDIVTISHRFVKLYHRLQSGKGEVLGL